MLKRLPIVLCAALLLASCSGSDNNNAANTPAPAPTSTAAASAPMSATPAAASTAMTPASTTSSVTPAASAPTAPTSTPAPAATTSTATARADSVPPASQAAPFVDNGKWVAGKNYFLIQPSQPKVTNTNKIEVVEAFSFACPACFHAHAFIDKLKASLPSDAVMAYLPVSFRPDENWPVYQRAYYTAQALGVADKTYDALFDATWKTGETATYDLSTGRPKPQSEWPDINTLAKFYSKYGVSPDQFVAVSKSFSINTKMKRADELVKDYGVNQTPTIIVDGKYRLTGSSAGSLPKMIELTQWLVAKERAGK